MTVRLPVGARALGHAVLDMSDLPAGTVTFLFTDIEGSTRLFKELGADYPPLLDDHNRLLREAFARHGGVEVKTEGDAFFVAFASADGAVSACVDGQRALAEHPWRSARPLVRMGLHSGEAYPVDGDYIALAVHQAARVVSAGHGGQILLSSAVRDALAADGPVELNALGAFMLKDFDKPEPLYQVSADGLDRDFPALRVPPAARHNLPRFTTSFIGRARESEELSELIATRQLVTILGPGGTGKTRLACELLSDQVDEWRDGARVALLGGVSSGEGALTAVADAVGTRASTGSPSAAIIEGLATAEMALLLDNCEHVLDTVRELCRELVQSAPGVTLLLTSRRPVGLDDEVRFMLRPLSIEVDAPALFTARACAVRPDFDAHRSPDRLESVCRRLDGLPLAIELAAARLRGMSLSQLDERLPNALSLLRTADGGRDARQQTVRSLIEWSTQLLTPAEAAVFRHAAIFHGGFTLEAAEHVMAGLTDERGVAIDVLDELTGLVDHSLLILTGEDEALRYRMLMLVRDVASESLRSRGEEANAAARHLAWVCDLSQGGSACLEEWDNTVAALDWAIASGHFEEAAAIVAAGCWDWQRQGRSVTRMLGWVDALLDRVTDDDRLRLAHAAFRFAFDASEFDRARSYLSVVEDSADVAGGGPANLTALLRAELCVVSGDFEEAGRLAKLVPEEASPAHRVNALNILGSLAFYRQDWTAARTSYEAAIAIEGIEGEHAAMLLTNIGETTLFAGQADAEDVLRRAIAGSAAADFRFYQAAGHQLLGAYLAAVGDVERAAEETRRSVEMFSAIDHVANLLDALGLLSRIELLRGDTSVAEATVRRGLEMAVRRRAEPGRGLLLAAAHSMRDSDHPVAKRLQLGWAAAPAPSITTAYEIGEGHLIPDLPRSEDPATVSAEEVLALLTTDYEHN